VSSKREVFSDTRFGLKISTSRLGKPLGEMLQSVGGSVHRAKGIKLVFGSPSRGLYEIFGKELDGLSDYVLNLYPERNTETVRTEEAIFAGLGLLNFISSQKA
jgi:predicted SPOUT superfamily RNA methylase MTH1